MNQVVVKRAREQLRSWLWGQQTVVLLYHRVAQPLADPQLLCVSPQHFAEQLAVLRRYCEVIPLSALPIRMKQRQTRRLAVITFDDGYADNLHQAHPLLARYETPATVFVASGYLGQSHEFWWDEITRLILYAPTLPARLRLLLADVVLEWDSSEPSTDTSASDHCWNVLATNVPTDRQHLYLQLCQLLRPLPETARQFALTELRNWSLAAPEPHPQDLPLSHSELRELADGGLVQIGAHTVTHSVLATLAPTEQYSEVAMSKQQLEAVLHTDVTTFSYPYGTHADFSATTVAAVRTNGFAIACANVPGSIRQTQDWWQLPRRLVRDWDGDTFERTLRGWFEC